MALVTAAEVRARGLKVSGTANDTEIGHVIAKAEKLVAEYLGLPYYDGSLEQSWESQTYTLYLGGNGGETLQLPLRPVTAITSIHADVSREYASTTEVESSDYTLDQARGQVVLDWDADLAAWPDDKPRSIKVVCIAGWATTPEWLKQVVADIVVALWTERKGAAGKQSKSSRGGTVTFRGVLVPPSVEEALQSYRVISWGD